MELFGIEKDIDNRFAPKQALSNVISFVWTEHYADVGSLELKLPETLEAIEFLKTYKYIGTSSSDRVMKVRKIHVSRKVGEEPVITVNGESLEFILGYRYLYRNTSNLWMSDHRHISGPNYITTWNGLMEVVLEADKHPNLLDYGDLRGLTKYDPRGYPIYEKVTRPAETYGVKGGTSVLDYLKQVSEDSGSAVGFRLIPSDGTPGYAGLHFNAYTPFDRTVVRTKSPVIFSRDNHTMDSIEYLFTDEEQINGIEATIDHHSGTTSNYSRYTELSPNGAARGDDFERYYKYQRLGYKSVVEDEDDDRTLDEVYIESAKEVLIGLPPMEYLEGEVSESQKYEYSVDYGLGDVVFMEHPFQGYVKGRVRSQTFVLDDTGFRSYPTVTELDKN